MEEHGIAIPFDIESIHENILKRLGRKLYNAVVSFVVRTLEIIISLIGVILLVPLAFVVYFQNIKNGENGPVFYTQYRIGKSGKLFKMYKFRTMVNNADEVLEAMLQDKEIAKEYKIFSVPTLVVFKEGKKIDTLVGLNSYDDILEFILTFASLNTLLYNSIVSSPISSPINPSSISPLHSLISFGFSKSSAHT